jgi:hypothetical protein
LSWLSPATRPPPVVGIVGNAMCSHLLQARRR